jgi:hypothetical protein
MLARFAFLAAAVLFVTTDAQAASVNRSYTGPRGTVANTTGSCANHACSFSQSVTGPQGKTASRQGSGSCANGSCTQTRSGTTFSGETWSRTRSVSR